MFKNLLRKLFHGEEPSDDNRETAELVTAPLSTAQLEAMPKRVERPNIPPLHIEPPQFAFACGHNIGRQRDVNQDSLFAFSTVLSSNSSASQFGLFIVADGMGGHQHGEVASELAVRVIGDQLMRNLLIPLIHPSQQMPTHSLQEIIHAAVVEAHHAILKKTPDGGTTLTAALMIGKQLILAHVGDSRAYHVTAEGEFVALSQDHTLVRRLEEMGQLSAEEAAIHPQRHVLYRALGQGEPFEPDVLSQPVPTDGYLLICSDGLWGVVNPEEMRRIFAAGQSMQWMTQELIRSANDAGGPDNISVILVALHD